MLDKGHWIFDPFGKEQKMRCFLSPWVDMGGVLKIFIAKFEHFRVLLHVTKGYNSDDTKRKVR